MPLRMQHSEGVGALVTRLDRSIQGFVSAVTLILFNVLPSIIFLGIAIWIMLRLDWPLAAVVLAFAPVPALLPCAPVRAQCRFGPATILSTPREGRALTRSLRNGH